MQGYFHFAEFSSRNVLNELRMICEMSGIDSFFRNSVLGSSPPSCGLLVRIK